MALKSTIYRMHVHLADMNRGHFAAYPLVLARHPSETSERLMMRVIAFCLHAQEGLRFGAGLSSAQEPDLVLTDLTGAIALWVEVGLPEMRWIGKALSKSAEVAVLGFGSAAARWSEALKAQYPDAPRRARLQVMIAQALDGAALERLAERNATLSCTIQDHSLWLTGERETVEVSLRPV